MAEANHDVEWVQSGPYPTTSRPAFWATGATCPTRRGRAGLDGGGGARTVVLAHLSHENNTPPGPTRWYGAYWSAGARQWAGTWRWRWPPQREEPEARYEGHPGAAHLRGQDEEKFYIDAAAEYVKRLSAYCKLQVVELPDERLPSNPSQAQIDAALEKEAAAIRARLAGASLIALCVEGCMRSSEELSGLLSDWSSRGEAVCPSSSAAPRPARLPQSGRRAKLSMSP